MNSCGRDMITIYGYANDNIKKIDFELLSNKF